MCELFPNLELAFFEFTKKTKLFFETGQEIVKVLFIFIYDSHRSMKQRVKWWKRQ
jgi:hypothetical protein